MNAAITTAANGLKRSLSATPFVMKMNLASDEDRRGASAPGLLAFLATASRRAASDNNDRLSTLWREVISLAGVPRSLSKSMVRSISGSGTAMALRQRRVLLNDTNGAEETDAYVSRGGRHCHCWRARARLRRCE